jgi:uncharacterized protein YjbI with pentapeptide repeats
MNNNDKKTYFGYGSDGIPLNELYINGFERYTYDGRFGNIKYFKLGLSYEELLNVLSSNNEIFKNKITHLYENFTITDDNFFKYINNVKSNFYYCNFDERNINDIKFSSRIYNSSFLNGNFNNCEITYKIVDCNFENSFFKLSNISAGFNKCNFTDINFEKCVFNNPLFHNCNLKNAKFVSNTSEKGNIRFYNCCMENIDMSNNDLSNSTLVIKECNTKNAKFNECVVKELDSDFTFHVRFLLKGGKIENTKDNYVDKVLTWIGQKIN